jgi:glycosidase
MNMWIDQAVFYHIYPLGLCDCPGVNDYNAQPVNRLDKVYPWLEHIAGMGFNALYIGPLFESGTHGYDTTDYFHVDRRLGDNSALSRLTARAHELGIRVILDCVFNHTGRDFWAFQDILKNRQNSAYIEWFSGLRFDGNNKHQDGLSYDCWDGHETLVKLNLSNGEVQKHLLEAVKQWVQGYEIDGLRLDAANVMDKEFLSKLAGFARGLKSDFWLMGEVIAGDYRELANPNRLDSVTNYECFKGLYSSFNDHNLFEIAWSLNRQFGQQGLYRDLLLYSFADNHDVNRVASLLHDPAHLIPLYTLMFSMPGVPSVYYGSEFGIKGEKDSSDAPLRPALDLVQLEGNNAHSDLTDALKKLIRVRKEIAALKHGAYRQLHLTNEQFAFARESAEGFSMTVINAADHSAGVEFQLPQGFEGRLVDVLQDGQEFFSSGNSLYLEMAPNSARLLMPG